MEITNNTILTAIQEQGEDLKDIKSHLKELNGTVKKNCIDIAVLKEKAEQGRVNWGLLMNLGLGIVQALVIWQMKGS